MPRLPLRTAPARRPSVVASAALALAALAAESPAQNHHALRTLDGERLEGRITAASADAVTLTTADGAVVERPLDALEAIELHGAAPMPERAGRVWLRSGAVLPAELRSVESGAFLLDVGLGEQPLRVAPHHVAALRLSEAEADYQGFERARAAPPATDDVLFVRDPASGRIARLTVQVTGLTEDRLELIFRDAVSTVPLERVYGIVFGRDNGSPPPPLARPSAAVRIAAGPTLDGRIVGWSDGSVEVELREGSRLAIPVAGIESIGIRSSRVAVLSSLDPAAIDQTPAFDVAPAWLRDAAPTGPGLVLDGHDYARGLCLVPYTRLTFTLTPGEFDVFEAVVGIDDRASEQAHATLRVLLDGEPVWTREGMTRTTPAETLRVPLGAAETLALEADFGSNFALGDHCVFARARLLKD